jgi:hypothetical protein
VSPVKYELRFYIPEDDILHSDRRENLKSYMVWFIHLQAQQKTEERELVFSEKSLLWREHK